MGLIEEAKQVLNKLNEHGYEAYIVGGYVRDLILNRNNQDIDIATNALPSHIQDIFPKTILTGLQHGTVTVLYGASQFEITTFRSDTEYKDHRRPENVVFVSSLEEDIKRRDFTMNALALSVNDDIIDLVNGQADIKSRVIRTVGEAMLRFSEDALRMLRAFRFQSTLGFSIHHDSLKAIKEHASLISNISLERIIKEIEHMIQGDYFLEAIQSMIETNIHFYLPNFKEGLLKIKETSFHPKDLYEFLSFCAVCTSYQNISQLPIPNYLKKEIRIVYEMYDVEMAHFTKPMIFRNGLNNCLCVNKLNVYLRNDLDYSEETLHQYNTMPIYKQCDLKFKGDQIIELYNKKPGGWISEILDDIALKVLLGELENDYEKIKQYLLSKK